MMRIWVKCAPPGLAATLLEVRLARAIERMIRISREAVETNVSAIAAQLDLPLRRPMARLA